jgi:hypothetical protein
MHMIHHTILRAAAALVAGLVGLAGSGLAADAAAQPATPAQAGKPRPAQATFETPQAAVEALVAAGKSGVRGSIAEVLGPGAGRVLRSGDPQVDAQAISDFLVAQQQNSVLEADGKDRANLLIGPNYWPLPFPLVRNGGRWRFDTRAGLQQYLDRQIGANELAVLEVLDSYVQAQREYVLRDRTRNGLLEYAQRMVSSEGLRDGLYWPAAAGEPLSPMGARFALASLGPLRGTDDAPEPFQGYYFRPLTGQGPHAADGAYDYIVKRHQIGGFALIATPARHGVSGLMSFIVNHEGVVFSKNLGRDGSAAAARLTRFDPDPSWKREPNP